MKTRFLVFLIVVSLLTMCAVCYAEGTTTDELHFDKYYLVMPEMNVRAAPDQPGAIDSITVGTELELLSTSDDGIWATFRYVKDGEERTGCTWAGAVSQGIRIHLLEDEFVFHKAGCDRTDLGMISTWREPTDPDLLILWEEEAEDGSEWLYVLSVEDCRAGYMSRSAKFEIVE